MVKKGLMLSLVLLALLLVLPRTTKAQNTTAVVASSCSASNSVAACISEGDRYSIITYYLNPMGNLNRGTTSYITLVVMDKRTGRVFITKVPERDFGNGKTFSFDPNRSYVRPKRRTR